LHLRREEEKSKYRRERCGLMLKNAREVNERVFVEIEEDFSDKFLKIMNKFREYMYIK
jgi:hypothetical protein